DRSALYERINQRAADMFKNGLVQETKALREKYGESVPALSSLGYKQAAQLLDQEIDGPRAIAAAQQGHRNYAKRQMTWFRREPGVQWIHGFGEDPSVQQQVSEFVSAHVLTDKSGN